MPLRQVWPLHLAEVQPAERVILPNEVNAAGIQALQNLCPRSGGSHLPAGCEREPLHRRCRDRVQRQTELRVRRRGAGRQSVCRRSRPLQSSPSQFLHGIQDIRPKSLSGKSDGCPKTLRRQPRMLGQDLIWRFPRCQLLQDQLHRNPGPRNRGFTHHNFGVARDQSWRHGESRSIFSLHLRGHDCYKSSMIERCWAGGTR